MTISEAPWGFTAYCSTQQNSGPISVTPYPGGNAGPASFNAGTNNAVGNPVTMITAAQTSFPVERVFLEFTQNILAATTNNALLDLLYDPAGGTAWVTFVPSIPAGGVINDPVSFDFRIPAPQGSSFSLRGKGNPAVSLIFRANLILYGRPTSGQVADVRGSYVAAIGADRASCRGTTLNVVTLGAGLTGSPWATLGTLDAASKNIQLGLLAPWTTNVQAQSVIIELGFRDSAGTQSVVPGYPRINALMSTSETIRSVGTNDAHFAQLPAGSVLLARGYWSGTTAPTAQQCPMVIAMVTH